MSNYRLITTFAFLAATALALLPPPSLVAQAPEPQLFPLQPQQSEQTDAEEKEKVLSAEQTEQVKVWIEELGAGQFAIRERAANELLEIGDPIISQLRRVAKDSADREVRLRAGEIVKQLTRGDMRTRIEEFLAGQDVDFEGWQITRSIIGDSDAIRELFVELIQAHPTLAASLDGAPRDRALAIDAVVTQVQNRMLIERKFPSRANAFAMLLPAVDPNVPLNATFESLLLSILQKDPVNKIPRDAQLSAPFRFLLNRWVSRSSLASREDVLLLGMDLNLEAALPLAVQTLDDANQTETLAIALQAIARFGDQSQAEIVRPLLDDERPAAERGFARGELVRTQIGDLAIATIAVLYDVPLSELGFGDATVHPTRGFLVNDIGFPANDEAPRNAARAKIDKLLEAAAKGS